MCYRTDVYCLFVTIRNCIRNKTLIDGDTIGYCYILRLSGGGGNTRRSFLSFFYPTNIITIWNKMNENVFDIL
jgi:hypothetical protein